MKVLAKATAPGLVGESDLRRAVDEVAVCTSLRPCQSNLFEITFLSPEIARRAQPGEFAQIWVERGHLPLLRRPFSFSRADPEGGTVSFYLGVVGEGSRRLRGMALGHRIQLLGPLGRGFSLPERPGRSALVSGGLGAAPFPLLAERLAARGEDLLWINGARNSAELYPAELIPAGIAHVFQFSEDGSQGQSGRVTVGLQPLLERIDRVYACGPNPMLAAVATKLAELAAPGVEPPQLEVSIEAPMGCGFGTCLGCSIPLRNSGASPESVIGLCCRQGPVLRGDALAWEPFLRQPAHLG
ncbi:MAG: dihydroorotate dehydrogenase electron transfer subunit [Candidatus Dormibacteria bacterium]